MSHPSACYPWTDDDDAILRRDYPNAGPRPLAEALGRTVKAVYTRAIRLGLRRSTPLRRARALVAEGVPAREAAEACGVRPWDLATPGPRGRGRPRGSLRPWTTGEVRVLREAFAAGGLPAAREALPDRTDSALWAMASRMGIRSGLGKGRPRRGA